MVLIFKGKGDIGKFSCYRAVKLLEYVMKVVDRVVDKWLCRIVTVDEMKFGSMPERGTIDAVFVWRRLQEEYNAEGKKLYKFFVDLKIPFDKVARKVLEWALR